jgi:hypothetical protein
MDGLRDEPVPAPQQPFCSIAQLKISIFKNKIGFLEHVQSGETNDKTRKPSEKLDRRRLDAAVAAVQISVEQ